MKHLITTLLLLAFAMMVKAEQTTPEGTTLDFELSGYVPDWDGDVLAGPTAATIVIGDDGESVWFSTLFPKGHENLWLCGKRDGDNIKISKDDVCYQLTYWGVTLDYRLGYLKANVTDGKKVFSDPQDVVIQWNNGTHPEVIGDGTNPERYVCLYRASEDGGYEVRTYTYHLTFQPVDTGNLVVLPADATVEDYVYYYSDDNYTFHAVKGKVGIDGNDYYFDGLTSTGGLMKGSRKNNAIVVAKDQYLGKKNNVMLFGGGWHYPEEPDNNGFFTPVISDATFAISPDGKTFSLANPIDNAIVAYQQNGSVVECNWDMVIKPYAGNHPATPEKPFALGIDVIGEETLFYFNQKNLDTDGEYLDPSQLSFYIYLDDEVYEFNHDYGMGMNALPYGKTLSDDIIWNNNSLLVYLHEDLFDTIGVQTVYNCDGVVQASPVISVDLEGNTYTNFIADDAEGVHAVSNNNQTASCYDLSGRRATGWFPIQIQNGRKVFLEK